MSVERVQCPSCGANLALNGRDSLYCSYCGARLRIQAGASGNPMAVLAAIKADTSLTAKRAALEHLEAEIGQLEQEQAALSEEWESIQGAPGYEQIGCMPILAAILLVVGLVLAPRILDAQQTRDGLAGLALLVAGSGLTSWIVRTLIEARRERAQALAAVGAESARVDKLIAEVSERAQRLDAEIDEAIRGM